MNSLSSSLLHCTILEYIWEYLRNNRFDLVQNSCKFTNGSHSRKCTPCWQCGQGESSSVVLWMQESWCKQTVCRIIWTNEQFHHASTSSEDRYDSHGFCVNLLHSSIISAGILSRLSFQPCQRDHAFKRSDNSNGLEFVRWETFTGDTWSHFPNTSSEVKCFAVC